MKKIALSEIKKNPKNPRTIKDESYRKLVQSIRDFPEMLELRPLVLDADMMVLGGNMRLTALKELGYKEAPCLIASELTEEQKRQFIIKDNIGYGEWDWNALGELYQLPELEEWGLEIPDFSAFEQEKDAEEDDFEVPPEDQIQTDIKYGDLFQIGRHRLLCGDSTKVEDVEKLMDGARADIWITDPPYNVDYTGKTKDALKVANDSMSNNDFRLFLFNAFTQAFNSLNAGASYYIFHGDSEGYNFRGAVFDCEETVRQCLIWLKQTIVMGRQDFHSKHEPCLYGWKKGASHSWYGDRKQSTILEFDRPSRSEDHPTMKPVKMISYLLQNSSKKEQLVLDTFLGSGSTMVAAHQIERTCYGMELEPKYCQVIIDRMKKLDPNLEVEKL